MVFTFSKDSDSGVMIISCPKRIDVSVSDELRDLINEIVEHAEYKIVLDLTETAYIDSSGLGAIVARISVLRSNNGDIRLGAPGKNVEDLLELTHLNQIIKSYPMIDLAVASFSSQS